MGLAIHEALKLEILERFKLVAGLSGLDRKITRVGIIDHEEGDQVRDTVRPGEFLVSNLLIIRHEPNRIVEYIKYMIEAQAACLAIKTIYYKELPVEAIEYANKHQFPVFLFDETYIDLIVVEVDKALNIQGHEKRIRSLVDQLLSRDLNKFRMREIANEMNRHFKDDFMVSYVEEKPKEEDSMKALNYNNLIQMLGEQSLVVPYRQGYLMIATYNFSDPLKIIDVSNATFIAAGLTEHDYRVGQSDVKHDLGSLGRAINECFYAFRFAMLEHKSKASFCDLGVYQMLIPLSNDIWVHSFYEPLIDLLTNHDQNNGTDLLTTAIHYIEKNGDVQLTSEVLFQHSNTIRYRLRKIAQLLGTSQLKGMVYEKLAMAIRLHLINLRE